METHNCSFALWAIVATFGLLNVPGARAQDRGFQNPDWDYPTRNGVDIPEGNLQIHADIRDSDGLMRDLIVEPADDNSLLVRAKYGRRGARNTWVLGEVLISTFNADGTLQSETRARRYIMVSQAKTAQFSGKTNKVSVVSEGGLQLRAQKQEANGLLRNVLIKVASMQSKNAPSATTYFGLSSMMRIYASYARRNPKQPTQWILGDAVIHNFNSDGSISSEEKTDRMELWIGPSRINRTPSLAIKKTKDAKVQFKKFPSKKPKSTAPEKSKSIAPKSGGFQLLSRS